MKHVEWRSRKWPPRSTNARWLKDGEPGTMRHGLETETGYEASDANCPPLDQHGGLYRCVSDPILRVRKPTAPS